MFYARPLTIMKSTLCVYVVVGSDGCAAS